MITNLEFKAAFGDEVKTVIVSQPMRGGGLNVTIDNRHHGRIIKHHTGWAIYLQTEDLNQGDADALMDVLEIPVEERDFIKGYRNPLWPDWYIKELDMLGL